jgi:hypothetical protein
MSSARERLLDEVALALARADFRNWPPREVAEKIEGTLEHIQREAESRALARVAEAVKALPIHASFEGEHARDARWAYVLRAAVLALLDEQATE